LFIDIYHTTFDLPPNPEIQSRLEEVPGYKEDEMVEKLIEWTDISLKIAALVNFLVFLQRGVYHSLLERVLAIQPVFPDKQGIRQVNYNDSSSIILYTYNQVRIKTFLGP